MKQTKRRCEIVKRMAASGVIITLILGMFSNGMPKLGIVNAAKSGGVRLENENLMVNDYIGLYSSTDGRFSIGTTGGNPEIEQDDNKKMLYGYSNNSTSYTTFSIDGTANAYRGKNGIFDTATANHNTSNDMNGIHIEQNLTFQKNGATGKEDIVEIRYTVTNNSETEKNVGCRIMIDTQLGENDNAPFRIPGYGTVTVETEFEGEDIPQMWQAFDSLTNPGVVSQGRFYKNIEDRPDKVQFANWRRLNVVNWELWMIKNNSIDDSAVAATWYEKPLSPGESCEYKTYYGMSDLSQDVLGPMVLSVYSESELEVSGNSYLPNPFYVNAYIENVGDDAMQNVSLSLELPKGLSLDEDSKKIIEIGEIKKSQLIQKDWKVKAEPAAYEQYYKIKVRLNYGNGESKYVTRTIHVPAIKNRNTMPKILEYTLFSGSSEKAFSMYGWQSYVTGNVYSGNDYTYQGSILGVSGRIDASGNIVTSGWQMDIGEINEHHGAVIMEELDADIMEKAGDMECFTENIDYTEDTTILDKSVYSEKNINFAGTNFIGNGYIISENNITCGLNQGTTFNDGKIIMYAKQGNITLNGSEIALDGILYAPKGTVYVNANIFRLRGRIIAEHIVINASQVFAEGDDSDIGYIYNCGEEDDEPEKRGFYEKTFSEEEIKEKMSDKGIWTVICDAGEENTNWNHITWNGIRQDDSDIEVIASVSSDGEEYKEGVKVKNGGELAGVCGRYLKVTAKLKESASKKMPRLIDITISTESADLLSNSAPVFSFSDEVYETEMGVPVIVVLESRDDAIGERSSYKFGLKTEAEGDVDIRDLSALSKQVTIEKSGTYNFSAVVSDGEFETERIITIIVNDPDGNGEAPEEPGEETEYSIVGQIERMEFNEDFSKLQVIGTAHAEGRMKKYVLSYGKEGTDNMQVICAEEREVRNDVLGAISTEDLENGSYALLLAIEDIHGNVCECPGRFELSAGQILPDEPETPEEPEISEKLTEDELTGMRMARNNAVEWLKKQADASGSWDKDGLMDTTGSAIAVLKIMGEDFASESFRQWLDKDEAFNIDEQCHAVWGSPDADRMKQIWEQQNADGGFGLTAEYTSDLYDTLLVLVTEIYVRDLGYPAQADEKLTNALGYIASRRNEDGGFGYRTKDDSRLLLTAEYAWVLHKLRLQIDEDETLISFCRDRYVNRYTETEFKEQAMLSLALLRSENVAGTRQTMQKVQSVQKENGSIYDSVEDTMLYIVLLDEMIQEGE